MDCLKTKVVAGPCSVCLRYQAVEVHIVGVKLYCETHCPQHRQPEPVHIWGSDYPKDFAAEQAALNFAD